MKRLLLVLLPISLCVFSCEDKDTTPTEVSLWGVVYSVEDTDSLNLSEIGLEGSIPSEIGNLSLIHI
mgnify:FL=1